MSVSVTKAEGVSVFTLTSDPKSCWPPLCQIFKGLCYIPVCCLVSQDVKKIQRSSQSVLGVRHILVGLLNIGLGAILYIDDHDFGLCMAKGYLACPFWLGSLFIVFGIMCILSKKYPSPCLVILTVVLNLAWVAFAITAIIMYSMHIAEIGMRGWFCARCEIFFFQERTKMLVLGINIVLIVLLVLELCVVISSVVLGIKALRRKQKESKKSAEEPAYFKPLLDEVTTDPGVCQQEL